MYLIDAIDELPDTDKNVVSVLSGGLDSSIMTMILADKYGPEKVFALSYDYGQKQKAELSKAGMLTEILGVEHKVLNLSILGDIVSKVSANISGSDVSMPTIQDVIGDPQPDTYVPFRNMILNSLAFSYAESNDADYVFTGLQVHDQYGYWDTSQAFVDNMNEVAGLNRKTKVKLQAPFSHLSKAQEIRIACEMGKVSLLALTLTCYNPSDGDVSCGKCPSCAERIQGFMKVGIKDPIKYSVEIPWNA